MTQPIEPLWAQVGLEAEIETIEMVIQLIPQPIHALTTRPERGYCEVGRTVTVGRRVGVDVCHGAAHRADLEKVHHAASDQPCCRGGKCRCNVVDQARTCGRFALRCGLEWEKSRLSHQLQRMEVRGLVTREDCAEDNRGSVIRVTNAGRKLAAEARHHYEQAPYDAMSQTCSPQIKWMLSA